MHEHIGIARTGLDPVLSALRGRRVNQLHQRAKDQEQKIYITSGLAFSSDYGTPTSGRHVMVLRNMPTGGWRSINEDGRISHDFHSMGKITI